MKVNGDFKLDINKLLIFKTFHWAGSLIFYSYCTYLLPLMRVFTPFLSSIPLFLFLSGFGNYNNRMVIMSATKVSSSWYLILQSRRGLQPFPFDDLEARITCAGRSCSNNLNPSLAQRRTRPFDMLIDCSNVLPFQRICSSGETTLFSLVKVATSCSS